MNPSIIQSIENWRTKSPQEILSELQAVSIERTDDTLYTSKKVLLVLQDPDIYRLVAGTINAVAAQDPLVKDAQLWLGTEGMDFSTTLAQSMVDQLAIVGSWPNSVRDAIKQIGKWTEYPYSSLSLQEVEATKADILADEAAQLAQAKRNAQATALRHAIGQLELGNTYTNAELIALVQSNLPSE